MEDFSVFNHNTCILLVLAYEDTKNNKAKCHLKYMYKDNLKIYNFKYITNINNIQINYYNPLICINMENESNKLRKKMMNELKEDNVFIRSYNDGRKKTLLKPTLTNINRFIQICEKNGIELHYSAFKLYNDNLMFNNTIVINNISKNREIDKDEEYEPSESEDSDDSDESYDSEDSEDSYDSEDSEDSEDSDDDVFIVDNESHNPPSKRHKIN